MVRLIELDSDGEPVMHSAPSLGKVNASKGKQRAVVTTRTRSGVQVIDMTADDSDTEEDEDGEDERRPSASSSAHPSHHSLLVSSSPPLSSSSSTLQHDARLRELGPPRQAWVGYGHGCGNAGKESDEEEEGTRRLSKRRKFSTEVATVDKKDAVFARSLHEALNGTPWAEGENPSQSSSSHFTPCRKGIEGGEQPASSETKDSLLADEQFARRLQEDEEAEAKRRREEQEAADEAYARAMEAAERLAEKLERRRNQDQDVDGPAASASDSKIIFQVTMDAEGKTIEGDEDADNAAHLALVKQDFANARQANLKIKSVTYFVNYSLNSLFEKAKQTLSLAGRDATERTLFHGTNTQNIQPILEGGFRVGGVDGFQAKNGQVLGVGVYLAIDPTTSLSYTGGANRMFACRVVLGTTTGTAMRSNPLPVGQNEFDAYSSPGVYVVRHPHQVLPRYVLEFEYAGYTAEGWAAEPGILPSFTLAIPGVPIVPPNLLSSSSRMAPAVTNWNAWSPVATPTRAVASSSASTSKATKRSRTRGGRKGKQAPVPPADSVAAGSASTRAGVGKP